MSQIRKRPVVLKSDEEITTKQLETIYRHYDDAIIALNKRRIAQRESLASTAELADVIAKINTLITDLNGSDLTED